MFIYLFILVVCLFVFTLFKSLHLSDLLYEGRTVCFNDLQIRQSQTMKSISLPNDPNVWAYLVNLYYTSASNVSIESTPILRRRVKQSSDIISGSVSFFYLFFFLFLIK